MRFCKHCLRLAGFFTYDSRRENDAKIFSICKMLTTGISAQSPAYPLFAISAVPKTLSSSDVQVIGGNFDYYDDSSLTLSEIAALHQVNPTIKTVKYLDSSNTTNLSGLNAVENYYRMDVAVFPVATLATDITLTDTLFTLTPLSTASIPLKQSTASGDYSVSPTTQNYVTWIRIDNELMKIVDFNPSINLITVARGLSGTTPVTHSAQAQVFSPAYVGQSGLGDNYPDGSGPYLCYAFDVSSPIAVSWIVDNMYNPGNSEVMLTTRGYDGMWYDTFSPANYNFADMFGNPVQYVWDFQTQAYATNEDKLAQQEVRLTAIQNQLLSELGYWPFLLANSMSASYYWPSTGNARALLMPTTLKPRPLDGYCIENFAGRVSVAGIPPIYNTGNVWRNSVMMLMDAAQNGLAALAMIASAGSDSAALEPAGSIRDAFELYGYASYLLGVEATKTTKFGIPAFYVQNGQRYAWVNPRYYLPIGLPTETQLSSNINAYRPTGHRTYMRHFQNGLVLVNPTYQIDTPITLDQAYLDPDTNQMIQSISMGALSGKILLL
jgi:hypothetical protein